MAASQLGVPVETLAGQVGELLTKGGTLGDAYDWNERDYEVLYALGHNLYKQGRYPDAMKAFGVLVLHNHLERRFASAYASSLQMCGVYDKAIEFHTLSSVMDMSDPVPTFHTAECFIQLRKFDEAREALQLVLQQSGTPERAALKSRAQAMLDLLGPAAPTKEKQA